jgi:hypothetical protein
LLVVIWDETFQQLYGAQIGGSFHVRHDLFNSHFGVYHESADWFFGGTKRMEISEASTLNVETR